MKLKFLRQSKVILNNEEVDIEVYKDLETDKLYIMDKYGERVFLNGMIGEEV